MPARLVQGGSDALGRTEEAVELAARAHVRHTHTDYDEYLDEQMPHALDREERDDIKAEARDLVRDDVDRIINKWRLSVGRRCRC